MRCPYVLSVQQVFHPPQISGSFLPHRRGEQDRACRRHARGHDRLGYGHEGGEAAGVVRDARPSEPAAAPLDRDVHVGTEHGVEVRGEHHRPGAVTLPASPCAGRPPANVPDLVDQHVLQPDLAEQLRHARRAAALGPGGRGDRRQRGLTGERDLLRALEVVPRGADALVCEQSGDGLIHQSTLT